jgi:ubiquinone/menaquinone biosynthesis C-methylase UbiE
MTMSLLRAVAEILFLVALIALWPVLRLVSLARPSPYPPWLTQMLEGPMRRRWANRDRCLDESGLMAGMRALEVGPGGGYVTAAAVERVAPDGRLVCLDVQLDMLRQVRDRLGPRSPALVCGSVTALPLRDGVFDLVLLVSVLGEVPDQDAALHECRRVLRPGGTISVTESLPDPDYVRAAALGRRGQRAELVPAERFAGTIGYTQRLGRPAAGGSFKVGPHTSTR